MWCTASTQTKCSKHSPKGVELLQSSDSSAIVLYKWEMVLVFNPRSIRRESQTARARIRGQREKDMWEEVGRGCGLCLEACGWLCWFTACQHWSLLNSRDECSQMPWPYYGKEVCRAHWGKKALPLEWALCCPQRPKFVSVPHTNSDEKQGSSSSRRESHRLNWLSLWADGECHHRQLVPRGWWEQAQP